MKNIILIGMPHSGKSTVGQLVSKELERPFLDIDALIEERYQQKMGVAASCREIFHAQGEEYFRSLEKDVFESAMQIEGQVIATGGGTPLHIPSFNKLTDSSKVFFLYCTLEVLWKRITETKKIPAVAGLTNPFMTFQELYKIRLVHYLSNSHYKIDASIQTEEKIAKAIVEYFN